MGDGLSAWRIREEEEKLLRQKLKNEEQAKKNNLTVVQYITVNEMVNFLERESCDYALTTSQRIKLENEIFKLKELIKL